MPLCDVSAALLTVGVPVSHYTAAKQSNKYIVWAEDGESESQCADNKKQMQVLQGTIDFFTKTENDPYVQKIQDALDNYEICWELNSVQYEDTKYIHYEWVFEVL